MDNSVKGFIPNFLLTALPIPPLTLTSLKPWKIMIISKLMLSFLILLATNVSPRSRANWANSHHDIFNSEARHRHYCCLLYTSDAADE